LGARKSHIVEVEVGTEVVLGPGDIVLDGYPAPSPQGEAQQPPIGGPCIVANGWIDQDAA